MSLLREIQAALMQDQQPIGPILLKLRFLASRLGSGQLEEWVKYESEGYPPDVELPPYRQLGVTYSATFSGPFGSAIKNAPIPPYLIGKCAGEHWNTFQMRQSVATIDNLIDRGKDSSSVLHIDSSNLILLLQGKIYEGYSCISVTGSISTAALAEIQSAVRTRILELTLQLEKSVPIAAEISLGPQAAKLDTQEVQNAAQITHQVIYGNYTTVENSGHGATLNITVTKNDSHAVVKTLAEAGIDAQDAEEFAQILSSEEPDGKDEPFGKNAEQWITKNLPKAASGIWKAGLAVTTQVLTEAAMRYYGFK
jgi:hypothetical protein